MIFTGGFAGIIGTWRNKAAFPALSALLPQGKARVGRKSRFFKRKRRSAYQVRDAHMQGLRGADHFTGQAIPAGFVAFIGTPAPEAAGSFRTGFFFGVEF